MDKFESDNEKIVLLKEPTNGKYGQKLWEMLSGKIEATTEEILECVPSSVEAKALTKRAKEEGIKADVYGPMAFDNSVSEKAAQIKGIKNAVAGKTDILLVPNVEAGNGLVKMMIFFMGACAAGVVVGGKVPVVITSRADDTQARLASIAAAVVAL